VLSLDVSVGQCRLSMPKMENTKLTKTVTVARYRELESAEDLVACGRSIVERFYERYFEPTVEAPARHGSTLMAIGCLVIEALECFYEGKKDSKRASAAMFAEFFKRQTGLEVFGQGKKDWFFVEIRCAILHQAETIAGWRLSEGGNSWTLQSERSTQSVSSNSCSERLMTTLNNFRPIHSCGRTSRRKWMQSVQTAQRLPN
jgi:hypothetical protein